MNSYYYIFYWISNFIWLCYTYIFYFNEYYDILNMLRIIPIPKTILSS